MNEKTLKAITIESLLPTASCRGAGVTPNLSGNLAFISKLLEGYMLERPGDPLISPLNVPAEVLRCCGFGQEDVRHGLLGFLAFSSVHLGHPVFLEILSPGNDVSQMMGLVRRMVPSEFVVDCLRATPDLMAAEPYKFRNRVIYSPDSHHLWKARNELNELLETGRTLVPELLRSKMRAEARSIKIEGPTGCVVITHGADRFLTARSALFIQRQVQGDCGPFDPQDYPEDALEVDCARARGTLKRLEARRVNVPFLPCLRECITPMREADAKGWLAVIVKLVSLVAVLRNVRPFTLMENAGNNIGVDSRKLETWMRARGLLNPEVEAVAAPDRTPLIATKFDFFVVRELLGSVLPVAEAPISVRQKEVLEAVRRINIAKGANRMWEQGPKEHLDRLRALHTSGDLSLWADIFSIMAELERNERSMHTGTLRSTLKALVEADLLARRKQDRTGRGNLKDLYGVTDFRETREIALPDPSEILDPVFNGRQIQVVNPVTGATVMI